MQDKLWELYNKLLLKIKKKINEAVTIKYYPIKLIIKSRKCINELEVKYLKIVPSMLLKVLFFLNSFNWQTMIQIIF